MLAPIRALTASLGLALLGAAALGPFSAAPAIAASTAPEIEAVTGLNADLWLRSPGGPWLDFGGQFVAAPAVTSIPDSSGQNPGTPFVVGTGLDHDLWTFNQQQGWQHLSSNPAFCLDNPAAVVTSAHAAGQQLLTVACQGANHALWFAQAVVGSGLAPLPLAWQSLGGVLTSGPAVAAVAPIGNTVDGEITFFGVGQDSHVWTRTVGTGWVQMGWQCLGHPAAATSLSTLVQSGEVTVFACDGLDHTLWFSRNFGSGWIDTQSLGGGLIDGPGVAVGPSTATFYVEGNNQGSWHRTITHGGNVFSWTSDGGGLQHGTAAAALLFASDNP
jgi:hypothetical protein